MNESKSEGKKSGVRWQHLMNNQEERYKFLFNNEIMSDIQFVVNTDGNDDKKRFYAHKFILAIHSSVFEAMFYGLLANDSKEIEIVDISPLAFENMLSFIYTAKCSNVSDLQSVFMTIYAADKYQSDCLMKACCELLKNKITPVSALEILVQANHYSLKNLANTCLFIIGENAKQSIKSKGFLNIDLTSLCSILRSNYLKMDEHELYCQVLEWSKVECDRQNLSVNIKNLRKVLGDAIKLIRFPLMTSKEIASISSEPEYCLLTEEEIVIIHEQKILETLCKRVTFNNNPRQTFTHVNVVGDQTTFCSVIKSHIEFYSDTNLELHGFTTDINYINNHKTTNFRRISLEVLGSPSDNDSEIEIGQFHHVGDKNETRIVFNQELTIKANHQYKLIIEFKQEFKLHCGSLKSYSTFNNCNGGETKLSIFNKNQRQLFYGLLFT